MSRRPIDRLIKPIRLLMKSSYSIGVILFSCAVLALIVANSPWSHYYFELWETHVVLGPEGHGINKTLHEWINDGLMSVFFFLIGLEIKREVMVGKLSTFRQAVLPMGAALGGMIIPAGLYFVFNSEPPNADGWGIPMATDIAFSLGLLAVVRSRVPLAAKVFLTALAIVDDLGAVLVISIFYTSDFSLLNLTLGLGFLTLMLIGNALRIRSAWFYGLLGGVGVWVAFLFSGVHATIAGVLAAFTIPARPMLNREEYLEKLNYLRFKLEQSKAVKGPMHSPNQVSLIEQVKRVSDQAQTPLQMLEYTMHDLVYFLILPIFAFSNAGIEISGNVGELILNPICLGVFFGLLIGKPVGIVFFTKILSWLGVGQLAPGVKWRHIYGLGFLAGIGFTMSLFIANLAFVGNPVKIDAAKIGILLSAIVASIIGLGILFSDKTMAKEEGEEEEERDVDDMSDEELKSSGAH
ncbi:Na+/H+ antiporter NhaA [Halocola ammonii]